MREKFLELRELFSDPKKWTRGCLSRDAKGNPPWKSSGEPVRWCAVGGINKIFQNIDDSDDAQALLCNALRPGYYGIIEANDQPGGRKIILKAIDKVLKSV